MDSLFRRTRLRLNIMKVGIDLKTLKAIRLINFQSHRNTLINLAGLGNLTVITGPSDSGKSSIIRALRLVFYNVPQGIGYIFNAEDKCTVSLIYDDGTTVERIRSRGGINRYHIYDSESKQGQVFEGFGTGVPLEVQQATGIRKLKIGEQNFLLNLSEQLDGPFLGKSVSGPDRAKVMGKLAGTEEIDYANKVVGTDVYRANRQKEGLDQDVTRLDGQIGKYGFISSWEQSLEMSEAVLAGAKTLIARVEKLKTLKQQWQEVCVKVIALRNVVAHLQEVDKGLDLVRMTQDELTKGNALAALRGSHFGEVLESERSKATLIRLDPVFRWVSPMVEVMVEKSVKASQITTLNDRFDNLSISVLSLRKVTQRLSGIEKIVNLLQQAFTENVQLSSLEGHYLRHKGYQLSVLSISGVVRTFRDLEQARKHLVGAIYVNDQYLEIKELDDKRELSLFSRFASRNAVDRYSGIEEVDGHLEQASRDNALQLKIDEIDGARILLKVGVDFIKESSGELTQEINVIESNYLSLMSTIGKCPTCGNDIDIQKLKEAI